ncbi:MAG TPA: AAA family ATPase, partial [Candidatus Nanoarchaeia archaeon]|nr:AAA family ATPase [Candidatus Nanoarchaeia archaeon]
VLDGIAYCIAGNIAPPPELEIVRARYTAVFLLDPLGKYARDAERKEDAGHARRIHAAIETVYTRSGIPLVRVPVLPPAERPQYILEHVRRIQ